MTMKVYFTLWKYFYACSCAILVLFVCVSRLTSKYVFIAQTNFTVANHVYSNWELQMPRKEVCEGKKIYMYDLPEKFNTLLLRNCSGEIVPWLNFCGHAENGGFGRAIGNWTGWFATDLYMVEVVFHKRMMGYSCLVQSMEEADAFFVPYYSGLDALRFLYGREKQRAGEHGSEVVAWLEENGGSSWRRKGGADHFVVTGRTAWDLCAAAPGWGTGLLELKAFENVTLLCVEGRTWVTREQAVPYLTSFHPASENHLRDWTGRVGASHRDFLFAFVGAERKEVGLRQEIIQQCKNSSSCDFLDCRRAIKCSHEPMAIMNKLLKAEFCLQPPGDSPTRRSTFDGLIAGCIPVFFRNDSAYQQYTWHLPADTDSYSVFIPEEELVSPAAVRIESVLDSYSRERKRRMRETIVGLIPQLVYMDIGGGGAAAASSSGSPSDHHLKDAFDVSIEGVLRRAREAAAQSNSIA